MFTFWIGQVGDLKQAFVLIKKVYYLTKSNNGRVKVSVITKTGSYEYRVVADESDYRG